MSVFVTATLPVYRAIESGVLLTKGEVRATGDASGGIISIAFSPWPTGAGQAGGAGEMWFPLWACVHGVPGAALTINRTGAMLWAPASWDDDEFQPTLDALGFLTGPDEVALRAFLRKPYLARFGIIGGANGYAFQQANGAGLNLTVGFWSLRIMESQANWESLIRLLALL